ncbi:YifB family Mg chelatase-like AAA ATPase [Vibrio parahaemolyticus]|nr:YifB family Mg chelatase-like AAA ATPase [Vibrio parahaemolyticus]
MAILSRISEIYSECGDVEFTVIEERLTNWGDTRYNELFLGPPGTGKTMLASRLCDLLPEMSDEEAMETASVASLTQSEINEYNWKSRPFRAPHHSSSMAALVGGGSVPRPGEISLAHNGLLFLDEMPEFDRKVLDSLREPLESGEIIISRAQGKTRFPARFQLVGALNPSPTGYYEGNQARTNPQAILRYLGRLSGPLLDRFDMSLEIPSLPKGTLAEGGDRGEPTELVKERVSLARESMLNRNGKVNALLGSREIEAFCPLQKSDAEFLETALHRLGLSIRAYHRIIKVARTIADLDGAEQIERSHLAEALGYRAMDRLLKQLTAQAV